MSILNSTIDLLDLPTGYGENMFRDMAFDSMTVLHSICKAHAKASESVLLDELAKFLESSVFALAKNYSDDEFRYKLIKRIKEFEKQLVFEIRAGNIKQLVSFIPLFDEICLHLKYDLVSDNSILLKDDKIMEVLEKMSETEVLIDDRN
ncbi:hypothetical protein ACFLR3_00865 [Campylobacterota bacterium]